MEVPTPTPAMPGGERSNNQSMYIHINFYHHFYRLKYNCNIEIICVILLFVPLYEVKINKNRNRCIRVDSYAQLIKTNKSDLFDNGHCLYYSRCNNIIL